MQLLVHFKDLSLHPKNAEELKGLILQLAVQGKLTAQWRKDNPDVEPASVLLERIKDEKEREKEKGRSNRGKLIDVIDPIKHYGNIPKTWNWLHLEDVLFYITDYQANGSFATLKENVTYYESPNHAVLVRLKDLRHQLTRVNDFKYTDEKGYNFLSKSSIHGGEFLIANVGAGVGTIMEVPEISFKATLAPNMFCIYPSNSGVDRAFFKYYSKSPLYWMELNRHTKGTGQPKINKSEYRSCRFPLPPLAEQKAIVATVNQLFAEVEQLEDLTKQRIQLKEDFVTSALRELSTQDTNNAWAFLQPHFKSFFTEKSSVKKLRESILQLAVQGKLTKRWREQQALNGVEIEDASILLERIKAEKEALIKAKKIKKEKPLPEITEEEIPYELPESWLWSRMGDIAEKLGAGSTPLGGKSGYVDEGVMFFRSQNIHNYYLKLEQVVYIPETTHEKMKGSRVKPKDLLLNITGGSIGRCTLVPDDFDTANVSQHVAIVRMVELEFREYIHSLIVSKQFQETIMDVQVGVSREGLSMTKLKMFLVPFPPLEEQKAIAQKVSALMVLCDTLENEIETRQTTQEDWMRSCLREVFEGGEVQ